MFIEDIKTNFYDVLLGNRVLLLVYNDVDAICTCKILQNLFKCDNITYTLVPVGSFTELKKAYEDNNEEVKFVILVNCGGTIDLVDFLQPEEDVIFFVLDGHKPTDVCNVYSDGQVRLVYKDSEESIPNFDDIFRDDEDEESEEAPRGDVEALVERRRSRRAWEERRNALMADYTQFSYYGRPSALAALELAWRLSRGGAQAAWSAAVAAAAGGVLRTRAPAQALLDAGAVPRHAADTEQARVALEPELALPLYRQWSVEQALRHAWQLFRPLRLHSRAAEQKLRQLLADMGVPLSMARGRYCSMDVELRASLGPALHAALQRLAPEGGGGCEGAAPALVLRRPLRQPLPAPDVAYALLGLAHHATLPRGEGFQLALAALDVGAGGGAALEQGFAAAKARLGGVAALVGACLGRPPQAYVLLGAPEVEASGLRGAWLALAVRCAAGAARRAVLAPQGDRLHAAPPDARSLFGAAFSQAARRCGASARLDCPDSSEVTLPPAQMPRFLDALHHLLAQ